MSSGDAGIGSEYFPRYSLSHLTLIGCTVPELVYIAARAGYDAIGPRLIQMGVPGESPHSPLDRQMVQATRHALDVTGIQVHDVELARIISTTDVKSYEPAMEVGAELGGRSLIASAWTNNVDDRNFVIDSYATICEMAGNYNLSVALEFPSFSRLRDLKETVDIVKAADQPNAKILIDTLYMHLSQVDISELDKLPDQWFEFIQVCDVAPGIPLDRPGMIQIARDARLYPGDGCVDFKAIIERLPPLDYCIELPSRSRVIELGYEEHARRCLIASKKTFENLSSKRTAPAISSSAVRTN